MLASRCLNISAALCIITRVMIHKITVPFLLGSRLVSKGVQSSGTTLVITDRGGGGVGGTEIAKLVKINCKDMVLKLAKAPRHLTRKMVRGDIITLPGRLLSVK